MVSSKGNAGECWKTTIDLISKTSNFARAAHFFCTFLCRCFAWLQRETSRNFLVTCCMEKMSYVFLSLFFHCCLFSPCIGGHKHFLFSHCRYKIVMLFFQQKKMSSLLFISVSVALFLVELQWPAAYVRFFSIFLFLYFPNLWTCN